MIDLVAGSLVGTAGFTAAVAWAASPSSRRARVERVERGGSSVLLGRTLQRVAYLGFERLGGALARAGVSADAVTFASLPFALAAAVALAGGHYGLGALLAGLSYACDALDGVVARASGTASQAGEILDSACDRVCEALLMGGVALAWRASTPLLVLALLAELGACQVTLASARAEGSAVAARDRVPRGMMRRAERAVYFVGGAALAGVLGDVLPPAASGLAIAPLVVAMGFVAVLGNASALGRFRSLARALRSDEVSRAG